MNKNLFVFLPILLFAFFFAPFFAEPAFSQGNAKPGIEQNPTSGKPGAPSGVQERVNITNPFTVNTVSDLINKLLDIIIKVGSVLALFFIIYAGFLFVTAGGSEDKIKSAKNTFLWTIIGVAIVLGAKAIAVLLEGTVTSVVGR